MPPNKSPSPKASVVVLRARVVLTISAPLIENGAVVVTGNRIASVGRWTDTTIPTGANIIDLGETILLPGLVNAHCHLDYTAMAGQLPPPRTFVDWIQLMMASKSGWIFSDFAESWLDGAKMLLRTGTTTVGDIEMAPELLPDVWSATPLRVFSFLEMTGVKSRRPPREILREALDKIASLPSGSRRVGLSPHAPYSTSPALLRLSAQVARRHRLRLVVHVAESEQEMEMFTNGSGKMHHWLSRNGRDMSDCGIGSPVQHLERQGLLSRNLMAVHVNYLAPGDAELLAKRKVSVCHCPRSHAYFKHHAFPLSEFAAAGVNICLGTDSLASVHGPRKEPLELNMFTEMHEIASAHPTLTPETILRMATVNGALALGMKNRVGELSAKSLADMIAIPHAGKIGDSASAAVHHRGDVFASMIGGNWAIALGQKPAEAATALAT